jgi:rhamnogalacturonyl hydrolase YesR
VRGRVVHESIFNTSDGNYRCPSTQQGYSPFSTWTRGQAWVLLGAAEELEFLETLEHAELKPFGKKKDLIRYLLEVARATSDHFIENSAADGIVYWDDGAPGLAAIPDWRTKPARPDNPHEPVDSSASAIAAQGLLRLGHYLGAKTAAGQRYFQAGLTVARTLLRPPYLSTDKKHQGLLLHSLYHRPNGWDHVPKGKKVPMGESSMWGDYHLMELAVYLKRLIEGKKYLTFFG